MKRKILVLFCLLLCAQALFAQTTKVRGRVIDSLNGEGVPFVGLFLEGTTVGTSTEEHELTALTKPVTVNLTNDFAANQFVKYTVGGKTQYLPTSDNGGKASFQTSDLTGTFEVVTNSDSVTITFNYFDGRVQTVTYTAADIGKADLVTRSTAGL